MRYQDLSIQTQREAPNNARTQGFAFLVRAGYLTRESELLPLGQQAIEHLKKLAKQPGPPFFSLLSLPTLENSDETYYSLSTGLIDIMHCPACGYVARGELAASLKPSSPVKKRSHGKS